MSNKPNILIFMTDHQRADTVLAENPAIMPNVEAMAKEGLTFTNAFCPMAHCCPSRASFFSGLYPSRSGIWNNVLNDQALSKGLKPGVQLFSEILRKTGYNLAFSGKWHVSGLESPKDRGWDELYTSDTPDWSHQTSWKGIFELAQKPDPSERKEGEIHLRGYSNFKYYGSDGDFMKHDERAVSEASDAIVRFAKEDKPWVVYVGAYMPHAAYYVPDRYLSKYELENIPLPASYTDRMLDKPNYYRKLREMCFDQLSPSEVKNAIRHYWAMCTYLDELFGRLLTTLEKTGQSDNTLVLYCSDHGDYLGEHGLFEKGVPSFMGAYKVPAVVRWPAAIKYPGRRVNELVSLADFAPTFIEMAGEKPDRKLTGCSLLPFFTGAVPENWRNTMFTQCNGVKNYFTQRMAFNSDFKYVYNGFDYDEFYDLRYDPHELVNQVNNPEFEDIKHQLVRKMWQFAYEEEDPLALAGGYIMVSTAPWGPVDAFKTK